MGNALAASNRQGAIAFSQQCYMTKNMRVVSVDSDLMQRALRYYAERGDKMWG